MFEKSWYNKYWPLTSQSIYFPDRTQLNFTVAIDFTASNGEAWFGEWDVEEVLRIGLDSKLGIRIHVPSKHRLEAKSSKAGTGAGMLGRGYGV